MRGLRIMDGLAALLAIALAMLQAAISTTFTNRLVISFRVCALPIWVGTSLQAIAVAAVALLCVGRLGGPVWARMVDDPIGSSRRPPRPRWRLFTLRYGWRMLNIAFNCVTVPLALKLDDPASPLPWVTILAPVYVALGLASIATVALALSAVAEYLSGAEGLAARAPPAVDHHVLAVYAETRQFIVRTGIVALVLVLAAAHIATEAARSVLATVDEEYSAGFYNPPVGSLPGGSPQAPLPKLSSYQAGSMIIPLMIWTAVVSLMTWVYYGALLPRYREVYAQRNLVSTPTSFMAARLTGGRTGGRTLTARAPLAAGPQLPPPMQLVKIGYHRYRRLRPSDNIEELRKAPPPPLFTPVAAKRPPSVGNRGGRGRSMLSQCLDAAAAAAAATGGRTTWSQNPSTTGVGPGVVAAGIEMVALPQAQAATSLTQPVHSTGTVAAASLSDTRAATATGARAIVSLRPDRHHRHRSSSSNSSQHALLRKVQSEDPLAAAESNHGGAGVTDDSAAAALMSCKSSDAVVPAARSGRPPLYPSPLARSPIVTLTATSTRATAPASNLHARSPVGGLQPSPAVPLMSRAHPSLTVNTSVAAAISSADISAAQAVTGGKPTTASNRSSGTTLLFARSPMRPPPQQQAQRCGGLLTPLPQAQPSPSTVEAANTCSLCCAAPPNAVLLECGHGGLCFPCSVRLRLPHLPGSGRCPYCREPISHTVCLTSAPTAHSSALVDCLPEAVAMQEVLAAAPSVGTSSGGQHSAVQFTAVVVHHTATTTTTSSSSSSSSAAAAAGGGRGSSSHVRQPSGGGSVALRLRSPVHIIRRRRNMQRRRVTPVPAQGAAATVTTGTAMAATGTDPGTSTAGGTASAAEGATPTSAASATASAADI